MAWGTFVKKNHIWRKSARKYLILSGKKMSGSVCFVDNVNFVNKSPTLVLWTSFHEFWLDQWFELSAFHQIQKYKNAENTKYFRGWPMVGAASKVYGWPHAGVGGGRCGCCPSRHDHFDQPGSIWNEDEKKKVNIKNYHFLAVPVGTIILTSSTLKRSQEVSETKMRRRRGLNITIVVDVVGGKSSVLLYKLSLV